MTFIENLTNNINADSLKKMISCLKERKKTGRKSEIAERINQIWLNEPHRLLDALSEQERILLAEAVYNNSSLIDVCMTNAKHNFSYNIPYNSGHKDCIIIYCFIFNAGRWSDSTYMLIEGISDKLKSLLPAPPALCIKHEDTLPKEGKWTYSSWDNEISHKTRPLQCYKSECAALTEAKRVLQLVNANKLKVSDKTGFPSAATQKTVAAALYAPDLNLTIPANEHQPWRKDKINPGGVRAFIWPILMQQCGWAKPKAGKLTLTSNGKALLNNFTVEYYSIGIQKFISDSKFDEMRRVSIIKGQSSKWALRNKINASTRRSFIFDCLEELPGNVWIELEEAYRILLTTGEDCCPTTNSASLYICNQQYGSLSDEEYDLGRIYFRQLIGESLTTLGLLDIGYTYPHYLMPELNLCWGIDDEIFITKYDGIKYIQLNALGLFCLGRNNVYEPPETEQRSLFKLLPNMEIVVTDIVAFSTADSAMLERFAKSISDNVWKLDRKTILTALEAGDKSEDILNILKNGSDTDIPETMQQLIAEVSIRASAASSKQKAVIITFIDKETAILIEHDTAASKAVLCRNGASLVIYENKIKSFQTALRKLGILMP